MTPRSVGIALLKRGAVAAVVAVVIVAAAWAIPMATQEPSEPQPLSTPEYDAEKVAVTPIPAAGDIEADTSVGKRAGLVVIDREHSNRFSRADIGPMVEALSKAGYSVEFYDGENTLDQALSNANAYVVIDPGTEFSNPEISDVRDYTNEGGHLLLVGEPTRKRVSASLFGTSISNTESDMTTIAGRYGMSVGTAYLYNLETNGGNYKHVTVRPTPESGLEFDEMTMYTAAPVSSRGGTVLLRAADNTHEAGSDASARHPVAVHKQSEGVLLLGDKTFLDSAHHNVGENEQFGAYVVEFLLAGIPPSDSADDEEADGSENGTATPGENETTETPTPTPEANADLTAPTRVSGADARAHDVVTAAARPAVPVAVPGR